MNFKTGYSIADGVTQSMLSKWQCCRQSEWYALNGLRKPGDSAAIEFGSFFHALRETFHRGAKPLGDIYDGCAAAYFKKRCEEGAQGEMIQEQINRAGDVWDGYLKRYATRDAKTKWVQVEKVFDVKFKGFRLRGKRDGIIDRKGKLWLYELKTKGEISEDIINSTLMFDFQAFFYATAWAQESKQELQGIVYDVVRAPKKADGVADDIKARPDHYYKRFEVPYSAKQMVRFRKELLEKLIDFAAWTQDKIPHYRNEGHCVGRGYCDFIPICSSGSTVGYSEDRVLFGELSDA